MAVEKAIMSESQWDDAVITASEEQTQFVATNLLRNGRAHEWASVDDAGTKTIKLNVPENRDVTDVWFFGLNATASAQWQVRYADSEANLTAAPIQNSGLITMLASPDMVGLPVRSAHHTFATKATGGDWLQIDITDAGSPAAGRIQGARVIVADALHMTCYPLEGSSFFSARSRSLVNQGPLGHESIVKVDPTLGYKRAWQGLTRTEAERLARMYMLAGNADDIAITGNPGATTFSDYLVGVFRFQEELDIRYGARSTDELGHWTARLDLRGV